jgi:hypothetical protein
MRGLTDSTLDEEPIVSMKPKCKRKTKMNTKSVKINNFPPNKAIAGTSTASTNYQSASKTSTAATAADTIPSDIANVNSPKKRKAKKPATKTALLSVGQCTTLMSPLSILSFMKARMI